MLVHSLAGGVAVWIAMFTGSLAGNTPPRCRLVNSLSKTSTWTSRASAIVSSTTDHTFSTTSSVHSTAAISTTFSTTSLTSQPPNQATTPSTITITVTDSLKIATETIDTTVTETDKRLLLVVSVTTVTTPTVINTVTTGTTVTVSLPTSVSTVTIPTPAGFRPLGDSLAGAGKPSKKRDLSLEAHHVGARSPLQPPPLIHVPNFIVNKINRRDAIETLQPVAVVATVAAKLDRRSTASTFFAYPTTVITVAGNTVTSYSVVTTTITPTGVTTTTATETGSTITSISTLMTTVSQTVAGDAVSTFSSYAACATQNFVSAIDGHKISGYDPQGQSHTFGFVGYMSDYDCCVTAFRTTNSIFWVRAHSDNSCWVYTPNTCPRVNWDGYLVTGACEQCINRYTAGNSGCGTVVKSAWTGEFDKAPVVT